MEGDGEEHVTLQKYTVMTAVVQESIPVRVGKSGARASIKMATECVTRNFSTIPFTSVKRSLVTWASIPYPFVFFLLSLPPRSFAPSRSLYLSSLESKKRNES